MIINVSKCEDDYQYRLFEEKDNFGFKWKNVQMIMNTTLDLNEYICYQKWWWN